MDTRVTSTTLLCQTKGKHTNIKLCCKLLSLKLFHFNIDYNTTACHTESYILPSKLFIYQLKSLKRLMRMIILHGPCNLVFMHPRPLMHLPLLRHLSPFLPVTQQVSDSQSLFNFLISSFPSHFSNTAWFISLSQSVLLLLLPFLFSSKFSSALLPLCLPLVIHVLVSCTAHCTHLPTLLASEISEMRRRDAGKQ